MAESVNRKPTVHKHENSGLQYLCGKDKVLFEQGVAMERKKFDEIKDTPGAVAALYKELSTSAEHSGFDWPFACSTGSLRRKKVNAELVASPKTARKRKKEAAVIAVVRQEEQKKKNVRGWIFSSVFLVMAVMTIVGIGSAIMSAYHTSTFLLQGGKPAWTAVITGIMLILFSGTAFTAARYFLQEKGPQRLFGLLFIVTGFAVIMYSIFSTVTVNYNQFKWVDDILTVAVLEDNEALAAHEQLLRNNSDALEEIALRINRLEEEASYWRTMSWRRYDEFQALVAEAQQERTALRQRRIELESVKPELVAQAESSQETIYTFLARLLGLPEDIARFFVYVVPACLYDILAPFALSVVLLLVDRRKKSILSDRI